MTHVSVIPHEDIADLRAFCLPSGKLIPVPANELRRFKQAQISILCHTHAIYCLPTTELIAFLKQEIRGRAIEIGAGNGAIARALQIPATDNGQQQWPEIKQYYDQIKQPVIQYPPDVELLPADKAIARYKPDTVIAAWVTERWKPGMPHGNRFGVDEQAIIEAGIKYIFIGLEDEHAGKSIMYQYPFTKYKPDYLFGRSMKKNKNAIWIFNV